MLMRRNLLELLGVVPDSILLAIGGIDWGFIGEPNGFRVETVKLRLKRLARVFSGLRLAQISDIHMGSWMDLNRFQRVAELIIAQKPDLLLLTGDFLVGRGFTDASKQAINDLRTVLSPLAASVPSFAVLGNHDYWTNPAAIREMLAFAGITDLTNTVFTFTREGDNLHLCGVDDVRAGHVRLHDVIAQLNDNGAALLLAHEPDFADTSAATGKFDLQISGHTHCGQVVIPFLGAPILPALGKKYPSGLYEVGDMFQYTNRGVGTDRLAIRINCPAEITIFILESMD